MFHRRRFTAGMFHKGGILENVSRTAFHGRCFTADVSREGCFTECFTWNTGGGRGGLGFEGGGRGGERMGSPLASEAVAQGGRGGGVPRRLGL